MRVDLSGLTESQREEHLRVVELHKLRPRRAHAKRVARMCPVDDCNTRYFGDPEWTCPQHGRAVVQENKPYFGVPTV